MKSAHFRPVQLAPVYDHRYDSTPRHNPYEYDFFCSGLDDDARADLLAVELAARPRELSDDDFISSFAPGVDYSSITVASARLFLMNHVPSVCAEASYFYDLKNKVHGFPTILNLKFYLDNDPRFRVKKPQPVKVKLVCPLAVPGPVIEYPLMIKLIQQPDTVGYVLGVQAASLATIRQLSRGQDITMLEAAHFAFSPKLGDVSLRGKDEIYRSDRLTLYHSLSCLELDDLELFRMYLSDVYDHRIENIRVPDQDYSNVFDYAKIIKDRFQAASAIVRTLPPDKRYYVPGDGYGIFSYTLKKYKLKYHSTEPNKVGMIARHMGIITTDENYDNRFDDGHTIMIAANIESVDYSSWKGPLLVFDEGSDCHPGMVVVPRTKCRLFYRGFKYKFTENIHCLDFTSREKRIVRKYAYKLMMRCNILLTPSDNLHAAVLYSLKIPVASSGGLRVGYGADEICLFAQQDHKVVKYGKFFGKRGDQVFCPNFPEPKEFLPRLAFRTKTSFCGVECFYRENMNIRAYLRNEVWSFTTVRRLRIGQVVKAAVESRNNNSILLKLTSVVKDGPLWYCEGDILG